METIYNVVNRFVVDDRATRAVSRMAASYAGLNGTIMQTKSLLGTLTTVGFTLGTFMLITQLKKALFDYNREIEQYEIAIGAIFNAGRKYPVPGGGELTGWAKFNNAVGEAQDLVKKFQFDAAKSIGTTKDFIDIAQSISDPLIRIGKGPKDIREFTNLVVATASVLKVDFPQAARDMMSTLTGTAGIDVKLYRLLGSPGGGAKNFNALNPAARYDLITKEMQKYQIAARAFEFSWKGLTSTIVDTYNILFGYMGRPIFETWKSHLKDFLDLLEKNQKAIDKFQKVGGEYLAKGLQVVVNRGKAAWEHRELLFTLGEAWLTSKMFGGISGGRGIAGFGTNIINQVGSRIGLGIQRYYGYRGMNYAVPSSLVMGAFPHAKGGIDNAIRFLSDPGPGLVKFLGGFLKLLGGFAIGAVVVFAIAGAVDAFRRNVGGATDMFKGAINRLIGSFMQAIGGRAGLEQLTKWLHIAAEAIGKGLITALSALVNFIADTVQTFARVNAGFAAMEVVNKSNEVENKRKPWWHLDKYFTIGRDINAFSAFGTAYNQLEFKTATDYVNDWSKGWKGWKPNDFIPGISGYNVPNNNTTINGGVHIYQDFKENQEPDRIAFATVSLLNRIADKPVQSKRSLGRIAQ